MVTRHHISGIPLPPPSCISSTHAPLELHLPSSYICRKTQPSQSEKHFKSSFFLPIPLLPSFSLTLDANSINVADIAIATASWLRDITLWDSFSAEEHCPSRLIIEVLALLLVSRPTLICQLIYRGLSSIALTSALLSKRDGKKEHLERKPLEKAA